MTRHDLISVLRTPKTPPEHSDLLASALGMRPPADEPSRPSPPTLAARTQIFNDAPAEVDTFGIAPFIRTLCDIVLSEATQTPLTICIDGEWGTGKTSIMQIIDRHAELVGVPRVWLNAWSLEEPENLISSVTEAVQREAERLDALEFRWYKPWKRVVMTLARTFLSMSGTGGRLLAELEGITGATSARAKELASVVTAQRSFEELVEVLLRAVERAPAPYDPKARGPAVKPRLIIFIDDIDRALPDQIVTTLKTLRLVLDNRHCVFILGMDLELVSRSIENYYSGRPGQIVTPEEINLRSDFAGAPEVDFGRRYLEKLIQLTVKVPGLNRVKVEEYLQGLALAPAVIEIVRWSPDQEVLNPRRLKRYVNWLSITLQLIKDSELPPEVSNLTALRILSFRRSYPELYRIAVSNPYHLDYSAKLIERLGEKRRFDGLDEQYELGQFLESFSKVIPPFEEFLSRSPLLRSTVGDAYSHHLLAGQAGKETDYPTA